MGREASPRTTPGQGAAGSSPPPVVFAGELLLWVASALRLSVVRTGDKDTSETTAKRAATGSASVSGERIRRMAHAAVRALVEGPYLEALGLDAVEAERLIVQITTVFEWFLERWDAFARGANHLGPAFVLLGGQELAHDVALRLAALCVRHALRHLDLLACAPHWTGNGVGDALKAMKSSCAHPPSTEAILARARITKNTFKALRDDRSLPQEETILRLANAFADLGARGPRGALSRAEIRFSLRVACLVREARTNAPWGDVTRDAFSLFGETFSVFLEILREQPDRDLDDLVAHGRSSRVWPSLSGVLRQVCLHKLLAHLSALDRHTRAALPDLREPVDEEQAAQWLASHAETLASLAKAPTWLGQPTPLQVFAEDLAAHFQSLAEGRPPPAPRQQEGELESYSLYMQALDPWREFAPGEREDMLRGSVEACPTSADTQVRFALAIDHGGQQRAIALQALREACRLDPDHPTARRHLAVWLFEEERFEEALDEATRHLEHHPDDVLARGVQGSVLLRLGQPGRARDSVDEALRYGPRLGWLLDLHARCLRALGDEVGARESERQAHLCSAGSLRQPDKKARRGRREPERKPTSL